MYKTISVKELIDYRFRCRKCHKQGSIVIYVYPLDRYKIPSSICIHCGYIGESEHLSPGEKDYDKLIKKDLLFDKHVKVKIKEDDFTCKSYKYSGCMSVVNDSDFFCV